MYPGSNFQCSGCGPLNVSVMINVRLSGNENVTKKNWKQKQRTRPRGKKTLKPLTFGAVLFNNAYG